jgi:hypothetical protein
MKRLIPAVCALILSFPAFAADKKKSSAKSSAPLEGCLDQKDDYYVLRTEGMLRLIAQLEPVGFDKTLFARFVGQKVSVPGKLDKEGDPPLLRVSNINGVKKLADVCAPGEP